MPHNRIEPYIISRRLRRDLKRQLEHVLFAVVRHVVSQVFMIRLDELAGPSRGVARVALARQVAMYLTATLGNIEHAAVGRLFGRDRKTVSHACMLVEDRRDDPEFDRTIELMQEIVGHLATVSRPPGWAAGGDDASPLGACAAGWPEAPQDFALPAGMALPPAVGEAMHRRVQAPAAEAMA